MVASYGNDDGLCGLFITSSFHEGLHHFVVDLGPMAAIGCLARFLGAHAGLFGDAGLFAFLGFTARAFLRTGHGLLLLTLCAFSRQAFPLLGLGRFTFRTGHGLGGIALCLLRSLAANLFFARNPITFRLFRLSLGACIGFCLCDSFFARTQFRFLALKFGTSRGFGLLDGAALCVNRFLLDAFLFLFPVGQRLAHFVLERI